VSNDPYFRERSPWKVGLVQLDAGPQIICHLHEECESTGAQVQVTLQLDKAGQAVFFATARKKEANWVDEVKWREMTSDPKFRRVLITDGRHEITPTLVNSLQAAECGEIFIGVS